MTADALIRAFRYRRNTIPGTIRDVSRDLEPQGACETFAWSVLCSETGGKLGALAALLTGRAMLWRAKSPVNGIVPRHAVLWLRGKGWIDSSVREWRRAPAPHRLRWPCGAPTLAVIAALFWASPLRAQEPQCAPLPDALTALGQRYQEAPRVQALTSAGALMIVTAAEGGGFSVLLVSPDGTACMVASGSGFEVLEAVKPGVDG